MPEIDHTSPDDPLNPVRLKESEKSAFDEQKRLNRELKTKFTPSSIPPPDVRSRMAHDAIKNSKVSHLLITPKLDERGEAIKRLEQLTIRVLEPYAMQWREALRNGFSITQDFEYEVETKLYADIQLAFCRESRQDLHSMLCCVLLGLFMEKLKETN